MIEESYLWFRTLEVEDGLNYRFRSGSLFQSFAASERVLLFISSGIICVVDGVRPFSVSSD